MADKIKTDADDGSKVGVDGTPATFINGMMISGAAPYSDFKAEIEKQLAK
jgi:protein-disulfide isomerase